MDGVRGDAAAIAARVAGRENLGRGIVYMVLAGLAFVVLSALAKWQTTNYSIFELSFFRSAFALLPCLPLIRRQGGIRVLRTQRPWGHALRSTLWCLSFTTSVLSFKLMPLADATAISFAAPLFATALAWPVLGERVGPHRWAAVVVGFIGVLVMIRPGSGLLEWGALMALASSLCFAVGTLAVRGLSLTEPSITIVFYTMLISSILALPTLPFIWVWPSPGDWLVMLAIGLSGSLAQLWMTQSYHYAPLSAVAPFTYTQLIWAVIAGFLFWGDLPDLAVAAGALVVTLSGLYILHRETGRRSAKPPAP